MSSTYWTRFSPSFTRDLNVKASTEYIRLARAQGWGKKSQRFRTERETCLRLEFSARYGTQAERLEGWQLLCEDVGIVPVPPSITQCKKELKKLSINLVDLVDGRGRRPVKRFPSRKALADYIHNNPEKRFPLRAAKQDGFLSALLITLYN